MIFEVCVETVAGALAAHQAGAQRIEVCSGLALGGLTPSQGLVNAVLQQVGLTSHVLIRPRPGDFCYSEMEFTVMQADIALAKSQGAHGVVLGLLTPEGRIDTVRLRELVSLARPLSITFHRAFDHCAQRASALETLIEQGIERVLTSGGAPTAWEGRSEIASLVRQSKGRIAIMAGGGITGENAGPLVQATQVQEIHFSARSRSDSPMLFRNSTVQMGAGDESYTQYLTDPERIREIIASVRAMAG
jgi:copper homeostasis protein